MSTGKLDDDGYVSNFGEGKWKLTKGSLIIAKGKEKNSLYLMQAKLSNGEVNAEVNSSSIKLSHKWLECLSQKGMQLLAKKKLLPDVTGIELQTSVDYLEGEQHKVAFKSFYLSRKSHLLDLVHTDVCYMKDKILGGAVYFVTFTDDFSRKVWCFALKSKDQVVTVFKYFQTKVERETGRKMKCFRSNNGGEFQSLFEQHFCDHGIRLEKSVPKTPQHNGVAEMMNKTICDRIKSSLDGDILGRVWSTKDIFYKHLRVFGYRVFVHIPKDERSNLDENTKPCTFLGYGHKEFGYRLCDLVNRKVIENIDIVFLNEQTSDDTKQSETIESSQEVPDDLDLVPSHTTRDYMGDVQDEQNDTTDDELVDDQVPPI